jgi:hypothetical protein
MSEEIDFETLATINGGTSLAAQADALRDGGYKQEQGFYYNAALDQGPPRPNFQHDLTNAGFSLTHFDADDRMTQQVTGRFFATCGRPNCQFPG